MVMHFFLVVCVCVCVCGGGGEGGERGENYVLMHMVNWVREIKKKHFYHLLNVLSWLTCSVQNHSEPMHTKIVSQMLELSDQNLWSADQPSSFSPP